MTFNATLGTITAKITLSGELDANSAPIFKAEVDKAKVANPKYLVLMMQDLEYMSSAGLRVLIYTKQKMGTDVDIYVVGAQEMVLETFQKTGFDQGVIVVDRYDEAQLQTA
jgi:anti-anti-sigma factor